MIDVMLVSDRVVFSTREWAALFGCSLSSASHRLLRLAAAGALVRLTRGVWVNPRHPHFTPFACVGHLLGSEQGYVSFLSALHRHGLLSQIPVRIQVATTGHGRIVRSPLSVFEFFQMNPRMMMEGVEWSGTSVPYRMAIVEKAFLDLLYLSTRKRRRFASLPELDWEGVRFGKKRFIELLNAQVVSPEIRQAILAAYRRVTPTCHSTGGYRQGC
jgi:hypothetical protein